MGHVFENSLQDVRRPRRVGVAGCVLAGCSYGAVDAAKMDPAPKRARLATGTGVGGAAAGPRVRVVFVNRTTGPLHLGPRDAGGAVRAASTINFIPLA